MYNEKYFRVYITIQVAYNISKFSGRSYFLAERTLDRILVKPLYISRDVQNLKCPVYYFRAVCYLIYSH